MNAALACGIILSIVLIIALVSNNGYNRAKNESTNPQTHTIQDSQKGYVEESHGFTPRR